MENKPRVAGALQSGTLSKCHAQLEAMADIILVATSFSHSGQMSTLFYKSKAVWVNYGEIGVVLNIEKQH